MPTAAPSFTTTALSSIDKPVRRSVIMGLVGAEGFGVEHLHSCTDRETGVQLGAQEPDLMMMRYAIYYLPEDTTPLWRFGSAIVGYDSVSRKLVEQPHLETLHDLSVITQEPRTYGFHATLKAPFRLAQGASEATLIEAAQCWASQERAIEIGDLDVRALGTFVALTPSPNDQLRDFAARCVQAFEPFRAPMTIDERAKRLRTPLTPRQIDLMDTWGYPYVFDEFRFHMTLTSNLTPDALSRVQKALAAEYSKITATASLTSICICAQPHGERFRLLRRFLLKPKTW